MSDKKSKILVLISAILLILAGAILYKIFDLQGYSKNKNGGYINYKVDDYVEIIPVIFEQYDDFYNSVSVSKVNFKNIDDVIIYDFLEKQDEIIDYVNGYYKEKNINNEYFPNNNVVSDIKVQINETVLSIFYELKFDLDENIFEEDIKNYIITLNFDLGANRLLSTEDILSKYNYSKEYISLKLFEEDILLSDGEVVIDKNTNISLTKKDIERKKDYYVDRIVDEFDNIIKVYIENNSLTLVYDNKELNELFFDNIFDTNIKIRYLK